MLKYVILLSSILFFSCKNQEETLKKEETSKNVKSQPQEIVIHRNLQGQTIYQYHATDIFGKNYDFSKLRGKKIMVVNTASECGFVDQLETLQALYAKYKRKGFVVIGFPSNDFGDSEPLSNPDIVTFSKTKYGVNFPLMSKISLKGNTMHPVYSFLTRKNKNGFKDNSLHWNFQKYLINENGHLDQILGPHIAPDSPEVIQWIKS